MQLSRFFTLAEMTHSDTAASRGIANQPDETATGHLKALCAAVLDPLRDGIQSPVKVNSGYRGPELNLSIGGAKKSQHMEGKAADIQASSISVLDLFKTVIRLGLPFDQVIYEAKSRTSKWVHVSHDPTRARGQILVADFGADGRVRAYHAISVQDALNLSEPATRSLAPTELTYEELADEPEIETEVAPPEAPTTPAPKRSTAVRRKPTVRKATKKRKATAKRKSAPKRKSPPKRKSAPKRKATPKRKSAAKRSKKHK